MFTGKMSFCLWINSKKYFFVFSGGSQESVASSVPEIETQQPLIKLSTFYKMIYTTSQFELVLKLK